PSLASALAIPSPIPDVDPVTMAVFPLSLTELLLLVGFAGILPQSRSVAYASTAAIRVAGPRVSRQISLRQIERLAQPCAARRRPDAQGPGDVGARGEGGRRAQPDVQALPGRNRDGREDRQVELLPMRALGERGGREADAGDELGGPP